MTVRRDFREIRVVALMVVGTGEGDRWLDAALTSVAGQVDDTLVYVDGPVDDATVTVLKAHADTVLVRFRGSEAPSFLEHEGRFRQGAWNTATELLGLDHETWIFLPDADEFFVPLWRTITARDALRASAGYAEVEGLNTVSVPIPEVWGQVHNTAHPLIRVDGQWYGQAGPRLVRWHPDATFRDRPMGSGSVPTIYTDGPHGRCFGHLLHYGYAVLEDVEAKWARYSSLADHGHANDHILSIRQPPQLEPYPGLVIPNVWRGARQH